jgi:hypothetical protein
VASGLLSTTFLTLLVVPVVYTILDQLQHGVTGLFRKKKKRQPAPETAS